MAAGGGIEVLGGDAAASEVVDAERGGGAALGQGVVQGDAVTGGAGVGLGQRRG